MRVAIFTPASLHSAIAKTSLLIEKALLALGHDVVIIRIENPEHLRDAALPFQSKLFRHIDRFTVEDQLASCDLLAYQIGDNLDFHGGAIDWLERHPGIVCLHDFFLANLFERWARNNGVDPRAVIEHWYGHAGVKAFIADKRDRTTYTQELMQVAPMTEWLCAKASGVVTHSNWGIARVISACAGPVRVAALPFEVPEPAINAPRNSASPLHLLTLGHVNENKRAKSVIDAIGSNRRLRQAVVYDIVGPIEPEVSEALRAHALKHDVQVNITGRVSDEELAHYVGEAAVCLCLRWPTLEAASGSTIECLLNGKATVVTDFGFYQELPDDCVIKIAVDDEVAGIGRTLESLVSSAELRVGLGQRARAWATTTFSAQHYAQALIDMASNLAQATWMNRACDQYARILSEWGGTSDHLILEDLRIGLSWETEPVANT